VAPLAHKEGDLKIFDLHGSDKSWFSPGRILVPESTDPRPEAIQCPKILSWVFLIKFPTRFLGKEARKAILRV
jgi:hypothetical protein